MDQAHLARYFDNAATTPLDPRVLERMLPYLREDFGNANSLHHFGRKAHEAVENAREAVAALVEADPSQIFFTSGATEANAWVVRSSENAVFSPYEHSSMLASAESSGWSGMESDGTTPILPVGEFQLASLMSVNNETGAMWDIRDFDFEAEQLHADATQAVGKLPFSVQGLSFASMSAHKLYGPKGIGALFCESSPPDPLLRGGEQEHGFRSGTLNVPGIVGFGAAAEIAQEELAINLRHVHELRNCFMAELSASSGWTLNGGHKTSPFILSVSFEGVEGESLVIEVDQAGFAISSGAACSSRSNEPSHVLTAMGLTPERIRGTVRISFGKYNTVESAAGLARALAQSAEKLRTMTKGLTNSAQRKAGV